MSLQETNCHCEHSVAGGVTPTERKISKMRKRLNDLPQL